MTMLITCLVVIMVYKKKIIDINKCATFVPCAAHSLNLVGKNSIDKNTEANAFFDLIEKLYGFFVYAPSRWKKLKATLSDTHAPVLKRASGTRWYSKNEAVVAIDTSYVKIVTLLHSFIEKKLLSPDSQATATGLINKLTQFNNIFMLKVWKIVLSQFNRVNRKLQAKDLNLSVTAKLYKSLIAFLLNSHEQFDAIFDEAMALHKEVSGLQIEMVKTRSVVNEENPEDNRQMYEDKFASIIQSLVENLEIRSTAYLDLEEKFAFLTNLKNLKHEEILESCRKITSIYPNDLNENELIEECQIAMEYFDFEMENFSHSSMYSTIIKENLICVLPNLEILLRMYLSLF